MTSATPMPPTTEQLLHQLQQLRAYQFEWLDRCRDLASIRMPPEEFAAVPEGVWRMVPWGHKVVVMHAQPVEKIGAIHVTNQAMRPPDYGWVLTVGESICDPNLRQAPTSGVCPYGEPLLLVGELVIFQGFNVRTIPLHFTAIDETTAQRSKVRAVSLLSVGDFHLPITKVEKSDWWPEQPSSLIKP